MLDAESEIIAVRLEGGVTDTDDDDVVDVSIESANGAELIQVKWSGTPLDRPLQPYEMWPIIGKLWKAARGVGDRPYVDVTIRTNRPLSASAKEQKRILENWRQLSDADLEEQMSSDEEPTTGLVKGLQSVLENDEFQGKARLIHAIKLDASLDEAAIDREKETLRSQLAARHLPASPWSDVIVSRVAEYCRPENAGKPIDRNMVASWLSLRGPSLKHDIGPPSGYVEVPSVGEAVASAVGDVAAAGGIVVLVGPPGAGKSVQLASWAQSKGLPFYACRHPSSDSDIPQRANQERFVRELRTLVAKAYAGRAVLDELSGSLDSEYRAANALQSLLDAIGAGSKETEPAVIVIDGVDDAARSKGEESFLTILQEPPANVVFVLSTQGLDFLPLWARTAGDRVKHLDMARSERSRAPEHCGVASAKL